MQSPPTTREIEEQLTQGVRDRLADGWALVDVRGDQEELAMTLAKGKQLEAHVARIDGKHSAHRIDVLRAMPPHPVQPDPNIALTLATPSGHLGLGDECGRVILRPYIRSTAAKGAAAGRLVANTLKASRDVEGTYIEDDQATFMLSIDGANEVEAIELVVTLESEIVVAAEIRNYGFGPDNTRFKRQSKLRKQLGATVTSISMSEYDIVLDGDKRFVIDAESYVENFPDADHSCGC